MIAAETGDVVSIVAVAAAVVLVAFLCFALSSLLKTMRALRVTVEELRRETIPLVSDMRVTVTQANLELARVDTLLGTAESISQTVDSASRLAYLTFSNPVIKVLAFGAGSARAAKRLRRAPVE